MIFYLNFDIDCLYIDFLVCNVVFYLDGFVIIKELENFIKVRMFYYIIGYFVNFEKVGYSLRYFFIFIFIMLLFFYCDIKFVN